VVMQLSIIFNLITLLPRVIYINTKQLFLPQSVLSPRSLPLTIIFSHGEAIGHISGIFALLRRHGS
jgi:hypothetical protein